MSGVERPNGYHLRKTGARVDELLSRQFVVPTLDHIPTNNTLNWVDGEYLVNFRVGEFVRVASSNGYDFYRLVDINSDGAIWTNATTADMKDYYTKKQIDDKLSSLVIAGGGGVQIVSDSEYASMVDNDEIIDNMLYFVIVDDEPYELYIGLHLIAKKGEIESLGFPYNFPIIF